MSKLEEAFALIDKKNAEDQILESWQGKMQPRELIYGLRMTEWLNTLNPEASEELQIAVRGQHITRWVIPRKYFPKGKVGYFNWRNELKKHHATEVGKCLVELGYSIEFIERVKFLIQKKNLMKDVESQMLEDTACLVFLQFYFEDFSNTEVEEKMIDIVKKTWKKMSDDAKAHALRISMSDACLEIVKSAIL